LAQDLAVRAASKLFAQVSKTPAAQTLARRLEAGGVLTCGGICPGAQPFVAALLHHISPHRPIVVVTEGLKTQESVHQDIVTWLQSAKEAESADLQPATRELLFYPAWEILPHETTQPHADVTSERLETLIALTHRDPSQRDNSASSPAPLVITSVSALLQRTFTAQTIQQRTRLVARGDRIDPLELIEWLEAQGYEPEAQVTAKGEMALRGGILDIYPLTSPWPVRLEFFGDELESLRNFDPLTQISREEIASLTIPPGGELAILKNKPQSNALGILVDYLPKQTIFVLFEPEQLDEHSEEYAQQVPDEDPFFIPWEEFQQRVVDSQMTLLSLTENNSNEEVLDSTLLTPRFQSLEGFRPLAERAPEPVVAEVQRREFFAQLHRWSRQGFGVHVFCNNEGERQRFQEIWQEYGLEKNPKSNIQPQETECEDDAITHPSELSTDGPGLWTHFGSLARGFFSEESKLVVVTDAEIFGRYKIQRPRRLKSPHAQATRSALDIDFTELEEGDYVVHLQHGIGRYVGLQVLPMGAGTKPTEGGGAAANAGQECLVLEYAPTDPALPPPRLYVPVTEAHLVSKYVGTGKAHPPLNTLGGSRWTKTKAQAAEAVQDVAGQLLAIQAARESQEGHAFAPDNTWQREFEGAFIYEETPDQMRAIVETKQDMERPKPMDRLICGDVGFGKTEVGIRAAFKAVMGGTQVALLVPTTVLAQQHFNTFRERMADYPIRVELLSRFRTRGAQQSVIKDLAAGSVDIVIGTHRLLQEDIGFKDLGLVIIDEEQRFGVMHKEKFKMLRKLVDVLTLSATPIPRTLYLALTGARDMSTIQTPPHDRLPVETIVTAYDERLIRDAIQREINRGGQVFFLHNRVMTIENMAQKIRELLPRARILVGHGQMHSDALEEVMTKFVNGEADVLLSTTIIESGLDIPNANTIIIDRADRFGLSDLYQLRGRVGRYKHQAYAYLLLPRQGSLVADVRKRLSAIKQFSTLGSGFKIAMRDLEIRGAGNLLGSEQSGHITAVGFDLYCQLLKQSVSSLKGEKVKPRIEVQVRLDFLALSPGEAGLQPEIQPPKSKKEKVAVASPAPTAETHASRITHHAPRSPAFIPVKNISDSRQRIEIYRKLAQATDKSGLQALEKELRDRFGPVPQPIELLLQVAELKLLAAECGITVMEVKDERLMLTRNNDYVMIGSKFPRLTQTEAAARLKEIKKFLVAL
jgi:transcription-repair coupling factor (superfamily II helicase)